MTAAAHQNPARQEPARQPDGVPNMANDAATGIYARSCCAAAEGAEFLFYLVDVGFHLAECVGLQHVQAGAVCQ